MTNYTCDQWADHYANRARGCEIDAEKARACGNLIDAERLEKTAAAYRSDEVRMRRQADKLDEYRKAYGRQHREL